MQHSRLAEMMKVTNMTNNTETTSKKFTKKELNRIHWRWVWNSQIGWNYERMQGLGYLTTMLPVIKKLYGDDPEATQKALDTHSQFFNTTPQMGDAIVGVDIAIEEEGGADSLETVAAVKTALMGPFAGIGDTIFSVISGTVFGSIACSTGVNGSFMGIILWECWYLFVLIGLRPFMFNLGYQQGARLVTTMSHHLRAFTDAASALGVMVVGCMIATMVNIKFGSFSVFGNVIDAQTQILDAIAPKLGAALLVGFFYWISGRKGMNSNKLIIIAVLIAILGSLTGILVVP